MIAARYSGAAVKVVCDPPQFELGVTNHSPEFLAKFPLGKVQRRIYTHENTKVLNVLMTQCPVHTGCAKLGIVLLGWLYYA